MFVSTYATFIGTNNSGKTDSFKAKEPKSESESFSKEFANSSIVKSHTDKNLPIDYISNYKSFNNRQKLQEQLQTQDELRLKQLTTTINAKVAYDGNSTMFSLVRKPALSLNLTPKIDEKLPSDVKEAKEKNLRHAMVNTYEANNRYFQITAA
ncbi:MAG: hypothetical protein QG560_955 [Campylobacterota bacterium]|nr:hypothetical protein [Campylobacterota bacterium]MDQ1337082.1 hypothetical protein [Campylobacterota bacterium]